MVYGRELDGEVTTFGTTGYTHGNTFLLYDRKTGSVWYPHKPGEMNAMSGPAAGSALPYVGTPERMSLAEWRDKYADSLVLVGDEPPPQKSTNSKPTQGEPRP